MRSINSSELDCVVIGYNEIPFDRYESFLRNYGVDSEVYRDLKFSFVEINEQKLDYVSLMNYCRNASRGSDGIFDQKYELKSGDMPNLAAIYLTNFLRRDGKRANYVNLFQSEKQKLIDYLLEDPLCVAITTTFYVVNLPVNEIVEFIRCYNSKTKIIVGGPLVANHVRNYKGNTLKAALEDMGADIYVVEGAGELTLSHTIDCLKNGGSLSSVPNLIYIENGNLQRTSVIPENTSLDENAIDWRTFANEDLGSTIQLRTARSCAFNCSFCNYPGRAGKLTLAGVDTVERELDSIRELGNVRNIVFIDDTFNVPLPRFKEICRMMIRNNYNFNWFSYFRCSNSDQEAIELMSQSGCKGVFLGIESGSSAILKNMNKAATVEKYVEGMKMLREHDILTFGSFIVGFPGETEETVQETINFIRENHPTYYRAQSWYCEPGTPIDRQREKYGITGNGFVWAHETMDSLEAMDYIEELFLSIDESQWLPQWSFDFWIIPYLIGRGIYLSKFNDFMALANKLLSLDVADAPERQKSAMRQEHLQSMINIAAEWR